MPGDINSPQLRIVHVLTLSGRNGEYGGPVRVAREISKELTNRGHKVEIFSGARRGTEPIPAGSFAESYVHVRPLLRELPLSSLWGIKVVPALMKLIKRNEIVHIHFARDLIPFTAAIVALLLGKPYIAQTHGMIISDGRISTKVIDLLLTKPLLNRSQMIMVLTEIEMKKLEELKITSRFEILPNGINVMPLLSPHQTNQIRRIIFCSRLQARKGVNLFVDLAEFFKSDADKYSFEIYGPDGGELTKTLDSIRDKNLANIQYKGALNPEEVGQVLSVSDLLVLPSKDEPFPMIVLESLSVGTPVLVMPSCGLSADLQSREPAFVAVSEDFDGLVASFSKISNQTKSPTERITLSKYCEAAFGVSGVVDRLEKIYKEVVPNV